MRNHRPLATAILLLEVFSGLAPAQEPEREPIAGLASQDPHLLWKFEIVG
jgi:hypothetical protein